MKLGYARVSATDQDLSIQQTEASNSHVRQLLPGMVRIPAT